MRRAYWKDTFDACSSTCCINEPLSSNDIQFRCIWYDEFLLVPADGEMVSGNCQVIAAIGELAADSKQMFVLPIQMNSGSPELLNVFFQYRQKKQHSKHVTIGNEEQTHKNHEKLWLFGSSLDLLKTKLVLCGGETLPCFCEGDKSWESRTTSTLTHNVLKNTTQESYQAQGTKTVGYGSRHVVKWCPFMLQNSQV